MIDGSSAIDEPVLRDLAHGRSPGRWMTSTWWGWSYSGCVGSGTRVVGERKANVALLARNEGALHAAADDIRVSGADATVCPVGVSDADAVERAASEVEARWSRIDIWVNVAMATVFAPVSAVTADEYRRMTEVSFLGYVHGTQTALRRMGSRNQGTIAHFRSALAFRSIPLQSACSAAKHSIVRFTDSFRAELIREGSNVRHTAVHFPAVDTTRDSAAQQDVVSVPARASDVCPGSYSRPNRVGEPACAARSAGGHAYGAGGVGSEVHPWVAGSVSGQESLGPAVLDERNQQGGRDNLFETLPGDPGAHGPYGCRGHGPDIVMRRSTRPRLFLASVATTVAAFAVGFTTILRR